MYTPSAFKEREFAPMNSNVLKEMFNRLPNNRIKSTKHTLGKRSILTTVQCAID